MQEQHDNLNDWYALVDQAKDDCGYVFNNGLDHYLVLTLKAFLKDTDIANNILALTYLENTQRQSHLCAQNVRYVGDQCLLISGLFPERAKKRNVTLGYYVDLGKNSYLSLAGASHHLKLDTELFYQLGTHFVGLMDVLHRIRSTN